VVPPPDRRRTALTHRCAWCGDVRVGAAWQAERRSPPPPATHAMCPRCFARLVDES